MNHLKLNPVGIDVVIHSLQVKLYNKLSVLWDVDLEGFPRCYSADKGNLKIIGTHQGNKEYKSLIHSEKNKFFFVAENDYQQTEDSMWQTKMDLYFILNLKECKNTNVTRQDEEVHVDVLQILKQCSEVGVDTTLVTGLKKVFQGYDYQDNLDMQPYHCFKLTLSINNFNPYNQLC